MVNEVTVNKTLFTTTIEVDSTVKVTGDDVCERLTKGGWQVVNRTFKPGMKVTVYRRPGKVS